MTMLFAALLLFGATQISSRPDSPGRYAVIIDAGSVPLYQAEFRNLLQLPGNPAGSMVDVFAAKGYEVTWIEGKGLSRYETLRHLYRLASELQESDTVVVYCGGYVVRRPTVQGGAYWLQEDGSLETLETYAVRLEELSDAFRKIPARRKLLLLDLLFVGDAAYSPQSDAKMQAQRQARFYPQVSLEPGSLPLTELTALTENPVMHLALAVSPDAASRLGSRGLLGAAIRDAIAGEADRNSNGAVDATEMVEYVRESIGRRAAETALSPDDIQFATLVPEDWSVAVAGTSVARERRERYLATLRGWRDRNWISVSTELSARSVLDAWIRSVENRTPLDPKTQELWDLLQKHMEGSSNDVERARSLEAQTRKRY